MDRTQYNVVCTCGASLSLDARSFGKPLPCRKCGAGVTVEWSKSKGVPVVSVAPVPGGVTEVFCNCGYSRSMPSKKKTLPRCPGCGKPMRVRAKTQAPMKVRVKIGARYFDCVCGERVLFRETPGDRPVQCPGCERLHLVEFEAPPPTITPTPKSMPAVPAPARAATRPLLLGEFLCECGEIQPPRTSKTGREFTCKQCGRKGYVEVSNDPKSKTLLTIPRFTSGPTGEVKPPSTAAATKWICPCGQPINAQEVLAKKEGSCPRCGRGVRVEKHHPHASMTTILPRFLEKAAADPAVSYEEVELELPAEAPAGPGAARCPCGALLQIDPGLVGCTIECPSCSAQMRVEREAGSVVLRAEE